MKKLLILFGLGTLLLTSCTSSDSPPVTESTILLKKAIITIEGDGIRTIHYTYNGRKIVKAQWQSNDGPLKRYTYTGNLITKIQTGVTGSSAEYVEEIFSYNGSGQLTTYLYKELDQDLARKRTFVYNADSTITIYTYGGTLASQTDLMYTSTVHLLGSEVGTIDITNNSGGGVDTHTYDTKNNPFKNVIGYNKLNFALLSSDDNLIGDVLFGISHNVLSLQWTNSSTEPGRNTTVVNNYNSFNFPTTSTITTHYIGTDYTLPIITKQYIYN